MSSRRIPAIQPSETIAGSQPNSRQAYPAGEIKRETKMTTAVTLIRRLHQHRVWVNENLLATASALRDDQLHQNFPIGQGSIWKSLLHLLAGEFVWLEALIGNDNPLMQCDLPGSIPRHTFSV